MKRAHTVCVRRISTITGYSRVAAAWSISARHPSLFTSTSQMSVASAIVLGQGVALSRTTNCDIQRRAEWFYYSRECWSERQDLDLACSVPRRRAHTASRCRSRTHLKALPCHTHTHRKPQGRERTPFLPVETRKRSRMLEYASQVHGPQISLVARAQQLRNQMTLGAP